MKESSSEIKDLAFSYGSETKTTDTSDTIHLQEMLTQLGKIVYHS